MYQFTSLIILLYFHLFVSLWGYIKVHLTNKYNIWYLTRKPLHASRANAAPARLTLHPSPSRNHKFKKTNCYFDKGSHGNQLKHCSAINSVLDFIKIVFRLSGLISNKHLEMYLEVQEFSFKYLRSRWGLRYLAVPHNLCRTLTTSSFIINTGI